jgi:hypothetical protein
VAASCSSCLCGFVAGKIDLYDLVTMQDQYQEHDAIEILKVVLAPRGHGSPACQWSARSAWRKATHKSGSSLPSQ